MPNVQPQQEHKWLEALVGEWTFEAECVMGPDQPPMKSHGSEVVRSLGGLWILAEGRGEMPDGGTGSSVMTLGYDPQKGCFLGTFIGSMMTHLWIYQGSLDAGRKVLTLDTEGPDISGNETTLAKYQDAVERVSDDHRILRSRFLADDGEWHSFMTAHYHRKQ